MEDTLPAGVYAGAGQRTTRRASGQKSRFESNKGLTCRFRTASTSARRIDRISSDCRGSRLALFTGGSAVEDPPDSDRTGNGRKAQRRAATEHANGSSESLSGARSTRGYAGLGLGVLDPGNGCNGKYAGSSASIVVISEKAAASGKEAIDRAEGGAASFSRAWLCSYWGDLSKSKSFLLRKVGIETNSIEQRLTLEVSVADSARGRLGHVILRRSPNPIGPEREASKLVPNARDYRACRQG